MTLFEELFVLFPYLTGVRKLKTYLTFDMSFPNTWGLPKKYVNESQIVENDTQSKTHRSISFVSEFSQEGVDNTIDSIKNVIRYNKEKEEKERLFESKVIELKSLFEKEALGDLKGLEFNINQPKLNLEEDEPRETTSVAGKGTRKRQERITEPED
jgi:hypothetical protein